jgi:predicted membrane channel-forming protein YqfA (hemolysin III family)
VLTQDVLVACIIMGLTTLVGLLGNALMIRALLKYVNLRIHFFILLGSVAVADMLCLVISVPMHIIHLTHGPVTEAWCKASK